MKGPVDYVIYRVPDFVDPRYYIRPIYHPDDNEAVLQLLRENWPPDRTFTPDLFTRLHATFVVEERETRTVVATASAGYRDGEPAVHWVAVHAAHRRRGLASALVERVLRYWQSLGVMRIVVRTNPATVENAQFYRSLGFFEYECAQV